MHLANISYRLGRTVGFDAATLTCPGDDEATAMLRRPYRAPYVVPETGLVFWPKPSRDREGAAS